MADPKYVRLVDKIAFNGSWTDMDSGFSIGGLDVQEFPTKDNQVAAVRLAIRKGILEEASADEFKKIHKDGPVTTEIEYKSIVEIPVQEQQIRDANSEQHEQVQAARAKQSDKLNSADPAPRQTPNQNKTDEEKAAEKAAAEKAEQERVNEQVRKEAEDAEKDKTKGSNQ